MRRRSGRDRESEILDNLRRYELDNHKDEQDSMIGTAVQSLSVLSSPAQLLKLPLSALRELVKALDKAVQIVRWYELHQDDPPR